MRYRGRLVLLKTLQGKSGKLQKVTYLVVLVNFSYTYMNVFPFMICFL